MPGAWARKAWIKARPETACGIAGTRIAVRSRPGAAPREKPLQTLHARIQTRDVTCVTPADKALALGTECAAGSNAEAHFAHHRLAEFETARGTRHCEK